MATPLYEPGWDSHPRSPNFLTKNGRRGLDFKAAIGATWATVIIAKAVIRICNV